MLSKILFTLAVIIVVALIWRTRQRRLPMQPSPRLVNPPRGRRLPWRVLAFGAVGLMVLATGVLLYDYWRERSEVIFIRVVDSGSGRATEYRAQRSDIGERDFVTTDGRHVVLAETERLETSTVRHPSVTGRN